MLVDSECVVAAGWLEGLREAAYSDAAVATASAMVDDGLFISDQRRRCGAERQLGRASLDDVAEAVRASSSRLRPRLSTAGTSCTYVRRSAIELAARVPSTPADSGFFDRCTRIGLSHIAADDVVVGCRNGAASRPARTEARTPVGRCLSAARRAISGLSVVVDARALAAPSFTGTQVLLLELLGALGRNPDVRVRAVVTRNIGEHARSALDQIDGVEVKFLETTGPMERGDVVHRPFQVWNAPDLALLRDLGERLVVTQLDLIAYRSPVLPPVPGGVGTLPVVDATLPRDRRPRRVLVRPRPPGRLPGRPCRARPRNRRAARRRPPVGADGRGPRPSAWRVTPYE